MNIRVHSWLQNKLTIKLPFHKQLAEQRLGIFQAVLDEIGKFVAQYTVDCTMIGRERHVHGMANLK